LTQTLAGPYGALLLADMGADVVKIERPPHGDPSRRIPPFVDGESAYFLSVNRNKRSMVLDLGQEAGLAVFYDLVRQADVVLDNFRPGVTERLRVDYPRLAQINPRIIVCSISAFGQDGPYRDRPAYDLVVQAMSGLMSVTGESERPPVRMGLPMGDLGGGLFAALGILAALLERERTGRGQMVDVSLLDGLIGLHTYLASTYFATGRNPAPVGSAHHNIVPYQAFATADAYLAVATFTEAFWQKLCRAMELEPLIDDPRFRTNELRVQNRETLIPMLDSRFPAAAPGRMAPYP
jgi:crotonobetainyl-CoA:carnitine CoA-transferase CaiB-like acyl-CoA transferase